MVRIENSINLLEESEVLSKIVLEVRRYEKNYIIYHDDKDYRETLSYLEKSRIALLSVLHAIRKSSLTETDDSILEAVNKYRNLMKEFHLSEKETNEAKELERKIRKWGKELVGFTSDIARLERRRIATISKRSRQGPIFHLIITFFLIVFIANFLSAKIVQPLKYIQHTTQRIAEGDYTPIPRIKKTKDEIYFLIKAFNKMIEEHEKHQDQLIQTHKIAAIGTLTSGIAHELNNPINNINMTAEYIMLNYEELKDQEKKELLEDIVAQGDRASNTVKDLLVFTRLKTHGKEEIEITSAINNTLRLLKNQLVIQNIKLEQNYPAELPLVYGNKHNLQQVFMNLLTNALHAMPSGGILQIRIRKEDKEGKDFIVIDVIDNGIGIKRENIQKIFEPFFTTKEVEKGTGLGLAVTFSIIRKHGGTLTVESEEGKETVFSVHLPFLEKVYQVKDVIQV